MFGKLAYAEGMNLQSLLTARFLVAGMILVAYVGIRRIALPSRRVLVALVLLGAVGYVGQSAAYFSSIRFIPAAVTSILLYTYPVIVTLLSVPLYGVAMTRLRAGALVLALAGCALVANPGGGLNALGVSLGLLSAVVYSGYILAGKRVMDAVDPWAATAVIALSAGVTYLVFGAATGSIEPPPTPRAWLWVSCLAVVSTVIGAGAFLAGLKRTDPGRASLISTLEPVSTAALAALVLGQGLGAGQLLGGGLVLGAVVVISLAGPRVADPAPGPGA